MTIRFKLLVTLLPPLIALFLLVAYLLHHTWQISVANPATCDQTFLKDLLIPLFIGVFISLALSFFALLYLARSLSHPIKQLNQAALEMAAGDYDSPIKVEGTEEFKELAHTLKTMGECLTESISRVKESSVVRERMYGEYECSLLMQYYMLQKIVEEFKHPRLAVKLIAVPLAPLDPGIILKIVQLTGNDVKFVLIEAEASGFPSLFQLCQSSIPSENSSNHLTFLDCQFEFEPSMVMNFKSNKLFSPLVWSIKLKQFIRAETTGYLLEKGDIVFMYNSPICEYFGSEGAIQRWLNRVLSHFAQDGLESIQTMLVNELKFLEKKQHTRRNFQLLSIQIRN